MNRELLVVRGLMVSLSLMATFAFLLGLGSGFTAVLFAGGGTLTQLAALLYLPGNMRECWQNGRLLMALLSAGALVLVVMVSVAGSASILSGLIDDQAQQANQRSVLMAMAAAKQESANRLIALDWVTKAQPLLDEVTAINHQIAELPSVSGFYLAAQRLGGQYADGLITGIIVLLSLLLDSVTLLLGVNNRDDETTVTGSNMGTQKSGNTVYIMSEPPLPVITYQHELKEIRLAIESGDMKSATVRDIRALLGCGQQKAMEIARVFKIAEDQLPLL